jgi:acetolactate synthase-1/2/3 large subunit
MSLGNTFKELYEIELETVINDELKPKKEGISMGETIEMIKNFQRRCNYGIRMGQHQMFNLSYSKFNTTKSNVTLRLGTMGFALQL